MIVLRALGNAEIETTVTTLTPSREIVFAAALYLVLERGKRVSRTRLASILWPRVEGKARAHRLRQTILQLKKLGITVSADGNAVRLEMENARTDFDAISERDLLTGKQESLEFLPGYDPAFSEEFRDWIDSKREQCHSTLTCYLLSMLQVARGSGNWMKVEEISGHCLALDAYNEVAILARAEAYAMRGQKAAGVSLLDRYIEEMAPRNPDLAVPATILRKRVIHQASTQTKDLFTKEPAFVGREAEMARLTRLLHNAQKGRGGGCLVNGDPGIGKTRLSSEFARFADLQGIRVERVACKRADMHQPLSAFVGLVPGLRELPGALGCSQKSVAWLKRLTEFDVSSEELPTRTDDSTSPYTNLRSAVFDLLDAVSEEGCLLIIVEDVQWLDRASVSLFGAILEWSAVKRLFFLFTSREARIPLMESVAPQVAAFHLRPLGTGEAASMIRTMMTSVKSPPDADALAWLINAGDGNPFFLQELTKQWVETGHRFELPHSVATVLDGRISRLSDVARQLIEACAVLGENSNLERLEHLLEYPPHDLLAALQELSTAGMLRAIPATGPATQSLLIRHDLLSIEVLNGLAPASLAFLHRRCGLALEREVLGSSISTSLLRACAFHWHHSGDSGRAYDLAVKCANHLLELGLALDAVTAFEGALVFCSTVEAQLDVLGRIVHALRMARDWPGLLKQVARIRALQELGPPKDHHDELEILEFEARRTTEIAIAPLLARTLTCVYDAGLAPSHRVRVASDSFKLATVLPDLKELERAYLTIKPLLTESTVDLRSRLQVEVVYNAMCGDLMEAVRLAKGRVAFERAEARPLLLANALTDLAFVLRRTGPDEEISSVLQEAYDIAIQSKLFAAARDCAERMLAFLFDSGYPGVETWMQRANESHGDGISVRTTFSVNAYLVRIALLDNRIDDAQQILQHAFDWEWVRHRKGWLAATTALRTRVEIARRSPISDLCPFVDELRQLYPETAMLGGQDYEIAALCAGLLYLGKKTAAERYLRDYLYHTRRDLTRYSRELTEITRTLAPDSTRMREAGILTIA
jgi:DNA-binding SARP family transcriptional activator